MQGAGLQPSQRWWHPALAPWPMWAGMCPFAAPAACPPANTTWLLHGDPPREKPALRFPLLSLQSQQEPLIYPAAGFATCRHRAGRMWELLPHLRHHRWGNAVQVK